MKLFGLINLLGVFAFVPWRILPVAREHGRSVVGWVLAGIGAWVGAELVVALCYAPVPWQGLQHWGWTERSLVWGLFISRAVGLMAAILAVEFVRRRLSSKALREPVKTSVVQPQHSADGSQPFR
jgi:hypothetical protein